MYHPTPVTQKQTETTADPIGQDTNGKKRVVDGPSFLTNPCICAYLGGDPSPIPPFLRHFRRPRSS